jgi:hypothetical protein
MKRGKNYETENRRRKKERYVDETVVSRRERTDKGSAPRQEQGTGEDKKRRYVKAYSAASRVRK